MKKINQTLLAIPALILALGCAALHVAPTHSTIHLMSANTPDTNRVIDICLDQDGFLWPESNRPPVDVKGIENNSLQLARINNQDLIQTNQRFRSYYTKHHQPLVKQVVTEITNHLNSGTELVVLIHGFNNNYGEADYSFKNLRTYINISFPHDRVYLDVHWDGLYADGMNGIAHVFWEKATTYSQMAGLVGLRDILNGLPPNTPVRIVTHSRGASVALSAIGNPNIDSSVVKQWKNQKKYQDYALFVQMMTNRPLKQIPDLKIAMIAPAIAPFDFDLIRTNCLPVAELCVAFNPQDPALKKKFWWMSFGQKFNATTFGYDDASFFCESNKYPGKIDRVIYTNCETHGILEYLDHPLTKELLGRIFLFNP